MGRVVVLDPSSRVRGQRTSGLWLGLSRVLLPAVVLSGWLTLRYMASCFAAILQLLIGSGVHNKDRLRT